jgi:hypothetical protein
MIRLLDQFYSWKYLVVEGEVEPGQILTIDSRFFKVLEVTIGDRGRTGLKVCSTKEKNRAIMCQMKESFCPNMLTS